MKFNIHLLPPILCLFCFSCASKVESFIVRNIRQVSNVVPYGHQHQPQPQHQPTRVRVSTPLYGWLDAFLPAPLDDSENDSKRRMEYPEQYPAVYDMNPSSIPSDDACEEARVARMLLKQTMLETRPLKLAYDANKHGWNAISFHRNVDGKGAAMVIATYTDKAGNEISIGGYNPKGWSSNGGARPSVAAFVFYQTNMETNPNSKSSRQFQKLIKVGGGGLACAGDDPDYGISFGPDALVIPLQGGRERLASSKLGPYFERGPDEVSSLLGNDGGRSRGVSSVQLNSLKVLTGVYAQDEEIPYSGAVMDMTSG